MVTNTMKVEIIEPSAETKIVLTMNFGEAEYLLAIINLAKHPNITELNQCEENIRIGFIKALRPINELY